jgi:TolB-like protein
VWIARRSAETRIAVTRFDNETGNPALDRFTDSVTDLLVGELTSSPGHYGVIGNAAILRRPRQQRDLTEIASTLRAQFVILGQIQPNGAGVRVLAHLIRMPQQTHVAVSRTDANLGDPLANAQKIAIDFARRLPHISQ